MEHMCERRFYYEKMRHMGLGRGLCWSNYSAVAHTSQGYILVFGSLGANLFWPSFYSWMLTERGNMKIYIVKLPKCLSNLIRKFKKL